MVEPATRDPLGLVGSLLDKKYRVDARVAEGGFGIVYSGRHIGLGRKVAIKVPKRPAETADAEWGDMVGRFLEEARLAAKLHHAAVVDIFDTGMTPTETHPEGLAWIAMEWLEGETLAADLARRRARGEHGRTRAETMELMRPVIDAIAEAHHAGIIHRDVNPNNVMLVPGRASTSARILDFGIAKMMLPDGSGPSPHTTTRGADRAFSLAYAAPEQLSGARTGPWTDVHALGLLLTELLCDKPALPAEDVDAHYRATFSPTRPTPASLGVDAGEWEPVLARALALDARERYASATELLAALDGTSASAPTAERAASAARADAPHRRSRWLLVAAPLVGLAAIAGTRIALRDGSSEPETPPTAAKCTTNAACSKPGAPAVCRPGVGCVALRSPDCEPFADDRALASDATMWIGGMFPRTGPNASWGSREVNAAELARRDFAQVMSGASAMVDRARPFGLVVCDDTVDYRRVARHLIEVGVPAVIGVSNGEEVRELTMSLFLPRRILTIASITTNPTVTSVPQPDDGPRLVWRSTYSSADAASAISTWIASDLEPALHVPNRPLRIALIRPRSDAGGDALGSAFLTKLHFNGVSAPENGANYRELTTVVDAPKTDPEYARNLHELLAFTPDIVIYQASLASVDVLFAPLEEQWRTGARRPRYISIAPLSKELLAFIGKNRESRNRFFGVTPVSSTAANVRFVAHYNEAFPDNTITRTINPNSTYDSFYLVAYASYAIRAGEPVTGERLARAIGKLVPPGPPIEVGIAGILDAYAALRADRAIDFTGATGKLDFDLKTGESAFDQSILCVGLDDTGKLDGIESGLVYIASEHRLEGRMRCP